MKLILNVESVLNGIQKALSVTPAKAGAAFLRALWIKAEGNTVTFFTTDANVEFMGTYPAQVQEEGLIGVQAQIFHALLSTCRDNVELNHQASEGTVSIVHKNGSCKLPVMSADWFQSLQSFPDTPGITWSGEMLKLIIDKVAYCIKDDLSQEAFYCVYFNKSENQKVDICALNGYQFSRFKIEHDQLYNRLPDKGLLIQKNYLTSINKLISNNEININFTETRFFVKNNLNEIVSIPLSNYEFPNCLNFLNRLNEDTVSILKFKRKDLLEALDRISTISNDVTDSTDFFFAEDNKFITCSGIGNSSGEVSERIDIQYNGSIKQICFRTKELIDVLEHFSSDEVTARITTETGPCGFEGKDDSFYFVVVMPVNTIEKKYDDEQEEY